MFKNKKGFTLIELLAVIVILAIILAIAIPSITGITAKAKEDSLSSSIKLIMKGIDYAVLQGDTVTTGSAISPAPYGASASDITTITISDDSPATISAVVINSSGKFSGCTVDTTTPVTYATMAASLVDCGS